MDQTSKETNKDLLYINGICDSGLNVWFTDYNQAKEYLDEHTGVYLLPYKHHFFVCGSGHIEKIGLQSGDPDWDKIGFDWVRPLDKDAKNRLEKKLQAKKSRLTRL
jgi:hypothetical protein